MSHSEQTSVENRLLAAMPAIAFEAIKPSLEPVLLPLKTVLIEANTTISHAHFLLDGIASHVGATTHGKLELGLIGREGMTAPSVLLGAMQTPHETFMQVSGSSLRITAQALTAALSACEPLRAFLLRYVQVRSIETAQTAISAARFKIEERTARWLLKCHDRVDGDLLPLTHEFLGLMLGVRRAGVTDSIHLLEGMKCIRATRGWIEVRDRAGLEKIAGDSYGTGEDEYVRLLGPWTKTRSGLKAVDDAEPDVPSAALLRSRP